MKKILVFSLILLFFLFSWSRAQEEGESSAAAGAGVSAKEGIFDQGLSLECRESGNCAQCDILQVAINIVHFLLNIAGPLGVGVIILGGFLYISSLGNPERIRMAQGAVVAGIVGFVIVVGAWVTVDFIIKILGYEKSGSWFKPSLNCEVLPAATSTSAPRASSPTVQSTIQPKIEIGCTASSFPMENEYDKYFFEIAKKYNLDPYYLKAVAQAESGIGKNLGPSSTGAYGIMQIQPSTFSKYAPPFAPSSCKKKVPGSEYEKGEGYCVSTEKNPDSACCVIKSKKYRCEKYAPSCKEWIKNNPAASIEAGARILADHKKRWGYELALAKYNGCGSDKAPCSLDNSYLKDVRGRWEKLCQKAGGVLK